MTPQRPPLGERLIKALQEGIEAARGERNDLVETWIDLEAADEGIRRSVHRIQKTPKEEAAATNSKG